MHNYIGTGQFGLEMQKQLEAFQRGRHGGVSATKVKKGRWESQAAAAATSSHGSGESSWGISASSAAPGRPLLCLWLTWVLGRRICVFPPSHPNYSNYIPKTLDFTSVSFLGCWAQQRVRRGIKNKPIDCKEFVRIAGSDCKDSKLLPTRAGRVVEKKQKYMVKLLTLRTSVHTPCFRAVS